MDRFFLELRVQLEPIAANIDPKAQVKQRGTIECLKEFEDIPKMCLTFL